ncbi:BAR domain containing protein [Acanthamoeba castellanii str. Neff]|uniref:BAR domain containing protein n=1 Tax=Acanthamoeba castellanii (strain ATCC 30010 / Neff) TaxID=1257118 RepID=L8H745_ACACF|nr:BAR domain containing protein [Acanthamoeba castellanii str. Neff]ELR20960.1 BAR domain containing protein [Acanthamoeba castellanii str. Neff]
MKKALGRWGQKAGESVGMVKRTTEVDEDFAKQVAASECRKDVQEKLVKHLTPDSMKGNLFSKNDLSQEEKMGEFLVKSGNTLAGTNDGSAYASALIAMGEMLKEIGEQHRQTDATIDERTIQPMKHFLDTKHDINQFKKRSENCRLDYEREKRAAEKKGESEALHQASKWYEESKEQYFNAMVALQDGEEEQISQLRAYVDAQAEFHQKCVEVLREASASLSRKAQEASSRPKHAYTPSHGGDSYSAPAPAASGPAYGSGELTFHAGDQINITNMVNAEWAEGELWGQTGIFPLNYVQML